MAEIQFLQEAAPEVQEAFVLLGNRYLEIKTLPERLFSELLAKR